MTEKSVQISERTFGPMRFVERSIVVSERVLTEPIAISRKEAIIEERSLSGPIRIVGSAYSAAPLPFIISGVNFTVTRNTITTIFTTSESVGCQIAGGLYIPGETLFSAWFTNWTLHGTAHSHQKTGLVSSTTYAIKIQGKNGAGANVYAPSSDGYYVVATADEVDIGGGYKFTVY